MSLINFSEIDLDNKSIQTENKIFQFNGKDIEVLSYLSIQDKYSLIMTTLKKAFNESLHIYNELLLQMYFDLHLVYSYSNIVFSSDDYSDEIGLYDFFVQSGFLQSFKENLNKSELSFLQEMLQKIKEDLLKSQGKIEFILQDIVKLMPDKISEMLSKINEINPEMVKVILNSFKEGKEKTKI